MIPKLPEKVWVFIGITVLFKMIIASSIELGNDEVYYYTYALQPDWNHFDHPPLVGLLIRLTTLNLYWLSDLSMRIGAIFSGAISSIFIFLIAKKIRNEHTAWLAIIIYNTTIYTGVIAGLFILPDSPQMLFWTASIYGMVTLEGKINSLKHWIAIGSLIGLSTLCKVHGLYLWAGFGLYILFCKRELLSNYRLYIAGVISLLCLLPIVIWNIQNDFITYKFHSERVLNHQLKFDSFLHEFVGEMLYQNPVIFVLIIISLVWIIRNRKQQINHQIILLLCISIPMIALFLGISLFNDTLPHWSGPGYIPLYIIAAIYLDNLSVKTTPIVLKVAGYLIAGILVAGTLMAHYSSLNEGSKDWEHLGEYAPTLDISGWNDFGKQMKLLVDKDFKKGTMKPSSPILVNKWFPAAHIEFYVASKTHQSVIATGKLEDLHKFAWLNKERPMLQLGEDAYTIIPSNINVGEKIEEYKEHFNEVSEPEIIPQIRGGQILRYFKVYRLRDCKKLFHKIVP